MGMLVEVGAGRSMEDPVVYQLVRVEGDGRLIPVTDDEIIEVEHLLKYDKNEVPSIDGPWHTEECTSSEVLSSKKSDFEGSEGVSQSGSVEINSLKLNAGPEYIDGVVQKVKHEEKFQLSCQSRHRFSKHMDVDSISADHLNNPSVCGQNLQSEISLPKPDPHSVSLSASPREQIEGVDTSPHVGTKLFMSGLSISELSASLKTKISMLKGEKCLDKLTVSELQVVFRATFGRETNVKDKTWLKRRVAMGLCKFIDLPMTDFDLEEKPIINHEKRDVSLCSSRSGVFKPGSLSMTSDIGIEHDLFLDSSGRSVKQMKDHLDLSGKRPRNSVVAYDANNEKLHAEQVATKRFRKPTKRYIEDHSDSETEESIDTSSSSEEEEPKDTSSSSEVESDMETEESMDTFCSSEEDSGHDESLPVSQIRSVENSGSKGNTFVTRQGSLGGSVIEIPYVCKVRRGRPRKDFNSLMDIAGLEKQRVLVENLNCEQHVAKHRKMVPSGAISDENANALPTSKEVPKRKHHRAWTHTEVKKLVEGVAIYGTGKWSEIKRICFASNAYRTSVDLKDKWRNLLKASFAGGPVGSGMRTHSSMPISMSVLSRVRELAKMHSQTGVELGSKLGSHVGRAVQKEASAFL